MNLDAQHPLASGLTADARLIRAYQGTRPEVTPVWFMRQAGRSLPEYRSLRVGTRMLDACLDPEMASEITLQPVRRHNVDAGILFSDIVIPLKLVGVDVEIVAGMGPVLGKAVRTAKDVAELTALDPAVLDTSLAPIRQAVARTVAELGETPLIGFAGAPFTLAAYLVEGGPSKDHINARTLMHADPDAWAALMAWTAEVTGRFLRAQVLAGASAAQLFDSWAGALSLDDYTRYVAPASAAAIAHVRDLTYTENGVPTDADQTGEETATRRNVPVVHFGVGTGELLKEMHGVGADVVGVDYRVPLDEANRRLGGVVPVQGNIDPALLAAPWPVLEAHVLDVLERGRTAPAHVLNLGHGVPPLTDPNVLTRLVSFVHELGASAPVAS
ncbi:uroporphyrinogen decarboxylase [Cryobacterium sp. MP_M5]|uniref:uroporphyrinogen decarboxylase n=1 Tax=unclassified Cryobacterium TaxID=2649013 RepID=UPI0018CADA6D|nr:MULTISPECIES: uroporphyrinogen decarboxylase [unclassified Cryobacterium]MBG6059187.1 uroporphyrinogen decarboxylase [Cryobacterium sp. MP_M3]MEC5177481.1 uroporphyrinogen decarboxylase [Cryobacterium sp. MP_M5]